MGRPPRAGTSRGDLLTRFEGERYRRRYLLPRVLACAEVGWFDVAVHDALLVRGGEPASSLQGDGGGLLMRKRTFANTLRQSLAFVVSHDEKWLPSPIPPAPKRRMMRYEPMVSPAA